MISDEADENVAALRRWLNGEDEALDEWLSPPRVESSHRSPERRAFPDFTIRSLSAKPGGIRSTQARLPERCIS